MEKLTKKQRDIIGAGRRLFHRYGLKKVTIDDICAEAGASKMTFYKYFPNKLELAKYILDTLFIHWLDRFWEVMRSDADFSGKMHRFMELKIEASYETSADLILEMYRSEDPEVNGFMKEWYNRSIDETIKMFTYAQKQGWMRKDLKPKLLLALMNGMMPIFMDEKIRGLYDNPIQLTTEAVKFFLYGISDER